MAVMTHYDSFAHTATGGVPSLCTYNVRGLSASALNKDIVRTGKIANVKNLVSKYGVTFIQETRLSPAHSYFKHFFPKSFVNYSSKSSQSAGTATIVNESTLRRYSAKALQLPPSLQGYIQATLLTPRDSIGPRLLYINCYLYTGPQQAKVKRTQLKTLIHSLLPTNCLTFLGGDFNFTLSTSDT